MGDEARTRYLEQREVIEGVCTLALETEGHQQVGFARCLPVAGELVKATHTLKSQFCDSDAGLCVLFGELQA